MNNDINLVSDKNLNVFALKAREKIFRNVAIGTLSVVVFFSILLFILTSTSPLSSIKKNEASALYAISFLHGKSVKLHLLNDRLKNISAVLLTRKDYTKTVNSILSQIPSDATANTFEIDKDIMTLKVNSKSLIPINKFIDSFIDLSKSKKIVKDIIITGLTLDKQTGAYSLSVKAKII